MNAMLSAIFFLSGSAALLFESLWFRQAGIAFGNSVWASALVLSSFMTGIALGNGLAARYGVAVGRPVRVYALLEIAVAVTGLGLVVLLPELGGMLAPVFRPFMDHGAVLHPLRFLVSFVLLLVPACAMGATLPLLVKALTREQADFGRVLGLLYGWNTLGGVVGAVIGELVLVAALGVRATGFVAASLNLLAACGAIVVIRARARSDEADSVDTPRARLTPQAVRLLVAAFLTGAILLALEVVWFRFLSLFISQTSRSFAVMLAVVLAGIGAGSLTAAYWLRKRPDAELAAFGVALAAGAFSVLGYAQFGLVLQYHPETHSNHLPDLFVLAVPLMFPVAFASGMLFPLLGAALNGAIGVSVRTAGLLTLANTAGAALGPLVAGFAMLSFLGMELSILGLCLAYGFVAVLASGPRKLGAFGRGAWLVAGTFLVLVVTFPVGRMDERYLQVIRDRVAKTDEVIIAYREGPSETIQYAAAEFLGEPIYHRLITNGFSMSASNARGIRYMRVFAILPAALHPGIENALLISYGLGNTAQSLTRIPDLETLDIVDISKDVLEMSEIVYPDPAEHPLRDPRVSVHIEDGRYFLQTTTKRFDLITGEPPPLRASRTVYLYTEEYFRLIRDRLREGGLVSYWLPVAQLSLDEASSILNAFCSVFEDCSLWRGANMNWTLVGSRGSMSPVREEMLATLWRDEYFACDPKEMGLERPEQIVALFLGDAGYLKHFAGRTAPLRDDRPLQIRNSFPQVPRDFFRNAMNFSAARRRFLESELISRIWPAALRDQSLQAFETEGLMNESLARFGRGAVSDEQRLHRLHRLLKDSGSTAAIFWNLGYDPRQLPVAAERAAAGEESEAVEMRLGAAALATRSWSVAARHFGRAAAFAPESGLAAYLEIYALARAGAREEASERLGREPGDAEVRQWLTRALDLQ